MRFILFALLLTVAFTACAPKVVTSNTLLNRKIEAELLKDLNGFSSNDISLKNDWWKNFGDEQLNVLIQNAIKNAPTLKELEAKYSKANNIIKANQSANLPKVDFNASASRQRFSENYIFPEPLGGKYYDFYQTGLSLDYDFDFWNSRSSIIASSKNEALAQKALIKMKELSVTTSIAKLYISWNYKIKKLQRLRSLKKLLYEKREILEHLYQLGLENKIRLNETNSSLEELNQAIYKSKNEIEEIKTSIGIIAGLFPSELERLKNPNISKEYTLYIPKDMHLDIVSHRPQIAMEKYLLQSKSALIENAKSTYYPNISLKGLLHFSSFPWSKLTDKSSFAPEGGVAFSLPIFDGAKRDANLNAKVNDYNAHVYKYNESVIKAVNEIVNSLHKLDLLKATLQAENSILKNKEKNIFIEKEIYQLGLKNKLDYLDSKLHLQKEELKKVTLLTEEFVEHINLIQALGGGYQDKAENNGNNK